MTQNRTDYPAHVLMTADAMGGVWTYAMELCQQLSMRDIRVSLAVMGAPLSSLQRTQAERIAGLDVYQSDFRLEWMDDPWSDTQAAGYWLLDLQHRTGADLVHLNGYVHGALPWSVPVVVVGHSCIWSWWRAVHAEDPPDRYNEYRYRVTKGLGNANAVVAPSAWMLRQLDLHYGPLPESTVIWNGRTNWFRRGPKQDLVFGCGRIWDEAKNLLSLCSVAPQLRWPVSVAGDAQRPGGERVVPHNVEFLGPLDQKGIATKLSHSPIYALPARYEPFGLSPLEAALAGCALVLGKIGSLQEIWRDAAIYVTPGDSDELVAAINGLIDDESKRRYMADRAHLRACQFTPDRMGSAYLKVYADARRHFEQQNAVVEAAVESSCA